MTNELLQGRIACCTLAGQPSNKGTFNMAEEELDIAKDELGTLESCTCNFCVGCCEHKPGWFAPGEAENAAALLGMSFRDFFAKYLVVDYYKVQTKDTFGSENNEDFVFLLSPAIVGDGLRRMITGDMAPSYFVGQCIFLKDRRCTIHAAKPEECRRAIHDSGGAVVDDDHAAIALKWEQNPEYLLQLKNLLGREPAPPEATILDALRIFLERS